MHTASVYTCVRQHTYVYREWTATTEAVSGDHTTMVKALCHDNAALDGSYVHHPNVNRIVNNTFQAAARDDMRALVVTERRLTNLQQWLATTTAIGFGALCVWQVEVEANYDDDDEIVELRFRLAYDGEPNALVCHVTPVVATTTTCMATAATPKAR
ncbi:Aste57867_1677 [Aphanomyces stellatus]|uniref:Aste57867_1677 protein n=1 Tax=Aphanomyces stellatus TaxID=120398 RepID=A0A485KAX9_9STRA|nr:hypothetical protein As57867_001675 [Aphanomyces stellatus]VFT78888.1 Aste57867_1677 [Aphanomyces stellatus]